MGRLHARVYSEMPQVELVGVYDANAGAAADAADEFNTTPFSDLADLLPRIRAATIAVPTKFHAQLAEPCLGAKIACLIEKPLASDVANR